MIARKYNSPVLSLTSAPAGAELVVLNAFGGCEFQRKIAALGIYPGEKLEVVERGNCGGLIIKVKGSRLAMGQGMCEKIKVKVV
ncbi:MAG: FeoA family protein [Victivallales bacterium]